MFSRTQVKDSKIFAYLYQSVLILVGLFIFFNPYPSVTAIEEISFYGSVLFLSVLLLFRKTEFNLRTPLSIPFLLFVLWSFLGLFFALNIENSVHDIYAHLIKYLASYFLMINFFDKERKLLALIWIIIFSTALYSAGMLTDFYIMGGYDLSVKLGIYMDGQHEIPSNIIGISTLFGLLLSLYQLTKEELLYRKIFLTICLCVTAIATVATQTRGTLSAMFIALLLSLSSPKNRKLLLPFIVFLIIIVGVMPVRNSLTPDSVVRKIRGDDRLQIWYNYKEIVKDYPLTGIGFGMQTYYDEDLLKKYNDRVPAKYRGTMLYKAPHNLLIDITVRVGLVGLMLFFYIIFVFARMAWKIVRLGKNDFIRHWGLCFSIAFIAVFIQSQFENTFTGPPAIILYTIFAAMTILWKLNAEVTNDTQAS